MGKQQPSMAVTGADMDDIGSVLTNLGFTWSPYSNKILIGNSKPDVIFVNCGSATNDPSLVGFVRDGGVVYVSDHACTDVEMLLSSEPTSVQFDFSGVEGIYEAKVLDQNLITYLDSEHLNLHFDMSAWVRVVTPPARSNLLLEVEGLPVLFTYNLGKGTVIFTSFHNSAQQSDIERKLIAYLALKPLLRSKTIRTVRETTRRGGIVEILLEAEPVLVTGSSVDIPVDLNQKSGRLTAELSWIDSSIIEMSLLKNGIPLTTEVSKMPPFRISGSVSVSSSESSDAYSMRLSLKETLVQSLLCSLVVSIESEDSDSRSELKKLLGN
jgi:hypothetical protein